jgi:hypothetical protein
MFLRAQCSEKSGAMHSIGNAVATHIRSQAMEKQYE